MSRAQSNATVQASMCRAPYLCEGEFSLLLQGEHGDSVSGDTAPHWASPGEGSMVVSQTTESETVDPEQVAALGNRMRTALTGWFTDEADVLDIWRTSSPAVRAAIREYYQAEEWGDLDGALRDNLEGNDLAEYEALDRREEDPVGAAIATLNNSISILNDDEAQIEETLRGLDADQREELLDRMNPQDRMRIQNALGGEDLEVYNALMEGDTVEAAAIRLDEAMGSSGSILNPANWFSNQQDAIDAFQSVDVAGQDSVSRRAEVVEAFNARMADRGEETSFDEELLDQFEGAERQAVTFTARGDDLGSQVAQLRATGEVWTGTDNEGLFRLLEETHGDREVVEGRFEGLYDQSLQEFTREELNELDFERAEQLRENGQLDPAFAMYYGGESGWGGTDHDMILSALQNRSVEEIAEIRDRFESDYAARYGVASFEEFLSEEYGDDGAERHEINMLSRYGNTTNPVQLIQRQDDENAFRRGAGNGSSRVAMNLAEALGATTAPGDYDAAQARFEASLDEDGNVVDQEALDRSLIALGAHNRTYDSERDSVAEAAATGAEVVAAAIATLATKGAASPWLVAAAGGIAGVGARAVVQGNAYSTEDMTIDVAQVAVQALTAGLTAGVVDEGLAQALRDHPEFLRVMAQGMAGGGIDGAMGVAIDEQALREGGVEYLLSGIEAGSYGVLAGGASSAVGQGVGEALGDAGGRNLPAEALRGGVRRVAGGGAGTVATTGARNLVNGTSDGLDSDQLVSEALSNVARGAVDSGVNYRVRAATMAREDQQNGRAARSVEELHAEGLSPEQIAEYQVRMGNPAAEVHPLQVPGASPSAGTSTPQEQPNSETGEAAFQSEEHFHAQLRRNLGNQEALIEENAALGAGYRMNLDGDGSVEIGPNADPLAVASASQALRDLSNARGFALEMGHAMVEHDPGQWAEYRAQFNEQYDGLDRIIAGVERGEVSGQEAQAFVRNLHGLMDGIQGERFRNSELTETAQDPLHRGTSLARLDAIASSEGYSRGVLAYGDENMRSQAGAQQANARNTPFQDLYRDAEMARQWGVTRALQDGVGVVLNFHEGMEVFRSGALPGTSDGESATMMAGSILPEHISSVTVVDADGDTLFEGPIQEANAYVHAHHSSALQRSQAPEHFERVERQTFLSSVGIDMGDASQGPLREVCMNARRDLMNPRSAQASWDDYQEYIRHHASRAGMDDRQVAVIIEELGALATPQGDGVRVTVRASESGAASGAEMEVAIPVEGQSRRQR